MHARQEEDEDEDEDDDDDDDDYDDDDNDDGGDDDDDDGCSLLYCISIVTFVLLMQLVFFFLQHIGSRCISLYFIDHMANHISCIAYVIRSLVQRESFHPWTGHQQQLRSSLPGDPSLMESRLSQVIELLSY